MGFEYALVHLKYTIPPALALTYLYRPFSTRLDIYRVSFLVLIAVVSTIPWDSYLIRQKVWTYPPEVVVGLKLYHIPVEELFFFVIQTYNTSLLYLILNKSTLHAAYLRPDSVGARRARRRSVCRHVVTLALLCAVVGGAWAVALGGVGTYMGLILVWAGPFALLLWSLSGSFIQRLPLGNSLVPILVPTVYLWIVDTIALRRGTWVIEAGTKLGIHVWRGLEVEEALFFLATNTLVVFGLLAFDNAVAVLHAFPAVFPTAPELPWPATLVRALLLPSSRYDDERIHAIQDAVARLQSKSRSFNFASAFFDGRLRIDLMLLYSFCRVADDLVDNAAEPKVAVYYVAKLRDFLDVRYGNLQGRHDDVDALLDEAFPSKTHAALRHLPCDLISSSPLHSLLDGFETDLQFSGKRAAAAAADDRKEAHGHGAWPIADYEHLEMYAKRVAGTVAWMCLELVLHHTHSDLPRDTRQYLIRSGERMGLALQYINIARDIVVDARMGRVYLPTSWLKELGLTPEEVVAHPQDRSLLMLRERLVDKADGIYLDAKDAIEALPAEARAPMRVVVGAYMEIGRVLKDGKYQVKAGRATVPRMRRLRVGWQALSKR